MQRMPWGMELYQHQRENPSQHNHAKGARYNVNYTQKGQESGKAQEWQQRKIFCLLPVPSPRKLEMPRKRHLFSCATALSGCKPTKEKALGHFRWGRQCCSASRTALWRDVGLTVSIGSEGTEAEAEAESGGFTHNSVSVCTIVSSYYGGCGRGGTEGEDKTGKRTGEIIS